jgi:hypothetical protein
MNMRRMSISCTKLYPAILMCFICLCGIATVSVSIAADYPTATSVPFTGLDGSTWEQVNVPGFNNVNNISVVAMAEYQGHLYALTRNQVQGCEVWRTNSSGGWEQVSFPSGVPNGIYGNTKINNVWARMIVFNGKLYFGFSSGLQGNYLGSTGAEIWRYDGTTWVPVISDLKDVDETGSITGISSCALNDSSPTATITDNTQSWTANQWAGGVLQITSGAGKYRKFWIISNTSNTLTIQQNEVAGKYVSGQTTEFTNCAARTYNNPFPMYSYTLGAVSVGDFYEIGMGTDENGFGNFWNKTITAMRIFNNILYVSTGLNYEYGAQVWYTENGDDWYVTPSTINVPAPYNFNSFGNFHTGTIGAAYPGGYKAVSSSVTDLIVSSVSGSPVLYAGGTGTSGAYADGGLGGCARVARLTANGWEMIVDINVDANSTGSNENGLGSPATCGTNEYNFQTWSFADFSNKLVAGIVGAGARVAYAPTGLADIKNDGSWHYSVGDGNVDPSDPSYVDPLGTSVYHNGFDGYKYTDGNYQNLGVNLFVFDTTLYGGIVCQYVPEYSIPPAKSEFKGSQIWKSPDGLIWTQVTNNGFGDTDTIIFEAFTKFDGRLYVSGSKGSSATPSGLGGSKIYRLVPPPECGNGIIEAGEQCEFDVDCAQGFECKNCQCVEKPTVIDLVRFEAKGKLARIFLKWETASEIDNVGFNIYRSESPEGPFVDKINSALIPAKGSATEGAAYKFVDWKVEKDKTYYYKLEDVDNTDNRTFHGPVNAKAWFLLKGKGPRPR